MSCVFRIFANVSSSVISNIADQQITELILVPMYETGTFFQLLFVGNFKYATYIISYTFIFPCNCRLCFHLDQLWFCSAKVNILRLWKKSGTDCFTHLFWVHGYSQQKVICLLSKLFHKFSRIISSPYTALKDP